MPRKIRRRVAPKRKGKGVFGDIFRQLLPVIAPVLTQIAVKKLGGARKRKARGVTRPGRGVSAPGRARRGNGLQRKSLI